MLLIVFHPGQCILPGPARGRYNPIKEAILVSKNQRRVARKPAIKFPHLRKKMQQQKLQVTHQQKKK